MRLFREKREPVTAQRVVKITNKFGMHARPAAELVRKANAFRSEVWLIKGDIRYSASSVIDVLRANLEFGSTITIEARGVDAEEALAALETVLREMPQNA